MSYPVVWSSLVGSPRKFALGIQLVSQPVPVKGQASVTCTWDVFAKSPNTISDVGDLYWSVGADNGWEVSGSSAPAVELNNSTAKIGTISADVPVSSRKPLDWRLWAGMDGIGSAGYWAMAEVEIDGYLWFAAPPAPTAVTATRVHDTRTTVSWTLPQDNVERVEHVVVQRWDAVSGVTKTIATLGYATSYTDRSTQANNRYRYTVYAKNRKAAGPAASSGYISTTPARPASVTAGRTPSGQVQVTWTNRTSVPGTVEVWDNPNGNYANTTKVGEVAWPGSSWTGAASTLQTHVYYLKHRTADTPILTSDDSPNSNTVALPSPPLAPSGVGPTVLDPADLTPLVWTHQTADTTGQQAYEVQYRQTGTSTWTTTGKQTSTVPQWATPGTGMWAPGITVDVQVRTWGIHANPGPWSTTALVKLDSKPAATVVAPAGTVNASLVTATLAYFDQEGIAQSAAEVQLLDAGAAVLETVAIDGPGTTAPLATRLADGAAYTVRARVRDGAGLWSDWATSAITVTYLPPPAPAATATWVPATGAAILTIEYVEPTGVEVSAMTYEVRRAGVTIAEGLAPEPGAPVNLTDPIPPIRGATYEVLAWSALPSSATTTVTLTDHPDIACKCWWNAGPGWSLAASATWNVTRDQDSQVAAQTEWYSGRELPVVTYGEARDTTLRTAATLYPGEGDDLAGLRAIVGYRGVICYRDPDTPPTFVHAGRISETRPIGEPGAVHVTIPMTVIDHQEG